MGAPAQGFTNSDIADKQATRDKDRDALTKEQKRLLNALIAHLQIITDEEHIVGEGDEIDGSN